MVVYNFQRQFVDAVRAGEKTQTIRASRKGGSGSRHAKPGERVQLYTALRQKNCEKLGEGICESVTPVSVECIARAVTLDGKRVGDVEAFARADGFESFNEMLAWFRAQYGPRFDGFLIKWRKL